MNYLKFYNGGNVIRKLAGGDEILSQSQVVPLTAPQELSMDLNQDKNFQILSLSKKFGIDNVVAQQILDAYNGDYDAAKKVMEQQQQYADEDRKAKLDAEFDAQQQRKEALKNGFADFSTAVTGTIAGLVGGQPAADSVNMVSQVAQNPEMADTSAGKAAMGLGVISAAGNMVDKAVMGDKNFGAQSAAIDSAVHTTSSALMQSGNPYAILAGAALETGNFLTKAGGQTVQGFDVDIKSSGYGNMGHKESSSSRDFGAILGLGGLNAAATQRKLKQRNEEAQMALKASNVADTIKFEQEARMNSVDDVIQQNEIALQGGIDTSLLAAKHGARLERIQKQRKRVNPDPEEVIVHENVIIETPEEVIIDAPVVKAQNGAKLEHIEVSEEQNVIPSGAMHKNKNHIDLEITEKGIPVITVEDDSVETFEEIKEQEDTLVQHAEVEEAEIIFNKELTIFVENLRKQWHEKDNKDDSICLEAGMRLAKEIIENTEDNTDVTEKSMEAVDNEEN